MIYSARKTGKLLPQPDRGKYDRTRPSPHAMTPRLSGEIRAALPSGGKPIGPYDLLFAVHARHIGAALVTNNEREFRRVPGLSVQNWLKA